MKNKKYGFLTACTAALICLTSCGDTLCQATLNATKSDTVNCVVCDAVMKQGDAKFDAEDKTKNAFEWLPTEIDLIDTKTGTDDAESTKTKVTVKLEVTAAADGTYSFVKADAATAAGVSIASDVATYSCQKKLYPLEFTVDCTNHLEFYFLHY